MAVTEKDVKKALREVKDPELGLDLVVLGLIYDIEIDGADANHPVPYENGYPTVDDCYNTAHDYAVICHFASGLEMNVTSRGDNGILFEGTGAHLTFVRLRVSEIAR